MPAFCTFASGINGSLAVCCPNAAPGGIEISIQASAIRGAKFLMEFHFLEPLLIEQEVGKTTHLLRAPSSQFFASLTLSQSRNNALGNTPFGLVCIAEKS